MGSEITGVEVMAFPSETVVSSALIPKPIDRCSVSKSPRRPLAHSCSLRSLPYGEMYDVYVRAHNRGGWSELVKFPNVSESNFSPASAQ